MAAVISARWLTVSTDWARVAVGLLQWTEKNAECCGGTNNLAQGYLLSLTLRGGVTVHFYALIIWALKLKYVLVR
jgi:hypothetical protein